MPYESLAESDQSDKSSWKTFETDFSSVSYF